jgi:hypothetical protein
VRLTFTVVEPLAQRRADTILDTEPEATASRVGAALAGLLRPCSRVTTLYVKARRWIRGWRCPPRRCARAHWSAGLDAGGVFRLDLRVAHIGGDPEATVGIEDPRSRGDRTVELAGVLPGCCWHAVHPAALPGLPLWEPGARLV